jgi:outer membrane protein assembly factor BamB
VHILKPAAIIAASSMALLLSEISGGAVPSLADGSNSPWSQTDYNAAQSRANLTEHILTPSAASHVRFLRGMASPPTPPGSLCGLASVTAPLLTGGSVYAITNNRISKYSDSGTLIWRRNPDPRFIKEFISLAVAGGLVVAGGFGCTSVSQPGGFLDAYNQSSGGLAWSVSFETFEQMVVSGSYIVAIGLDAAGGTLEVRNLTDGSLVWADDNIDACGDVALVVAGLVVQSVCDSVTGAQSLEAFKIATGTLAWSIPGTWTPQRGDLSSTAGRHLYATDPSGAIASLDPLTGHTQYTLSKAVSVLAVDQARVYATCGGQNVCAYNISTGALEWQSPGGAAWPHTQAPFPQHALSLPPQIPAAEADGVLYLDSGRVMNAATGKSIKGLWSQLPSTQATALAVGDGHIAAVTDPRVLDLYGLPGS